MRPSYAWCLAALALTGCQALQLQHRTVGQSGTLAALHQQQVLDNLAIAAATPGVLPSFALANKGTTTVQDSGELDGGLNWDYTFLGTVGKFVNHLDKKNLAFRAIQQDVEQWNTDAILNPDKLWLMRCADMKVVGSPCMDPDCDGKLLTFFKPEPQLLASIHPGWLCIGRKHDVPHETCGVAHCGDVYVWVPPGGGEEFARFCLAILNIATAADSVFVVPAGDPLAKLETRVKTMADLYKSLPEDTAEQRTAKAKFAAELLSDLAKLQVLYSNLPADKKQERFQAALKGITAKYGANASGVLGENFQADQEQDFSALLQGSQAAPALPLRKDFNSYPIYPNVLPIPP